MLVAIPGEAGRRLNLWRATGWGYGATCCVALLTGRQDQRCWEAEPLSPVPKLDSRGTAPGASDALPHTTSCDRAQTLWHSKSPVLAFTPLILEIDGAWRSLVERVLWESRLRQAKRLS